MAKRFTLILLAILALSLLAFPAVAQDDDDDEVRLILPLLEDGDSFDDLLTEDSSTRLYAFNGSEGDEVTIYMEQESDELDPYLILLGPAGEMIAADDDSGREPLSAELDDVELPFDGTYFIVATSYSLVRGFDWVYDDDELEFELSIDGLSPTGKGDDDSRFLYYSGDLPDGETITGAATEDEAVFYWTFYGELGQEVDIELESNDFDTLLYLFAPGGFRIAGNDDAGGTDSEIEDIKLPEDGIYIVFATGYLFTENDFEGGEFDIRLDVSEASSK